MVQRELFQSEPVQAQVRGWPEPAPRPVPHVSMPLGEYGVKRLPGVSLPGTVGPSVEPLVDTEHITTEHIACKNPLQPVRAELAD